MQQTNMLINVSWIAEMPLFIPIIIVAVLCAILGTITGLAIAVLKVPHIATLSMQLVLYVHLQFILIDPLMVHNQLVYIKEND